MADRSLRRLLVGTFTALTIGAGGAGGWLSYQAGEQAVMTLASQLMAQVGDRIDQRLAGDLAGLRGVVETNKALIQQGRLDPDDSAALARHFAAQLRLFPGADSIGVVTGRSDLVMLARQAPNALIINRFGATTGYRLRHYRADLDGRQGELIESHDNDEPDDDPPDRPWYPAVRAAGQGSWRLSVSLTKGQDQPALVSLYALPFDDDPGGTQGVLVAGMTLTGLGEFLQGLRVSAHGQAVLIDREGLLVATSTGEVPFDSRARADHADTVAVANRRLPAVASTDPVTRQTARHLRAVQPALTQSTAPLRFDFDVNGQRYLAMVASSAREPSHPDWLTLVVVPQRDFTALIAAPPYQQVLLIGLALVIAVLLGLVAAEVISRRVGQLHAATGRLAEGDIESAAKFRAMFEQSPLGIALIDPLTGGLLEVNERLLRIIGRTREELVARGWTGVTHPDDRSAEADQVARLRAGEIDGFQLEKRYLSQDGAVIWGDLTVVSVDLGGAEQRLQLCLVEDITARKQAQTELRKTAERYRMLTETMKDIVWVLDPERLHLDYVSPSCRYLYGYTADELMTYPADHMLAPQARGALVELLSQRYAEFMAGGCAEDHFFSDELSYIDKNGTPGWVEAITHFMRNTETGRVELHGVSRNISDRKCHEQELAQARDAAETANRAKSDFLAHMSHEIRTPMNVVLGLAQVLSRGSLTTDQRDMIVGIQTAGQSLLCIINDVLDLSKIEAGALCLERCPFVLATLMTRLDSLMAVAARSKGLAFRVEVASAVQGPLVGDALRLEQVLLNLIGNAVKFTEQGEVTLAVSTLWTDAVGVRLRFEVRDAGIGIPAAALERLFSPFTQADQGITRRFGGTGLGLAISKRLVALMGGDIAVASQVGQGSTFSFELSFEWAAADETGASAAVPPGTAPPPTGPRLTGRHILVVDDSAMNRDLAERALALEGASVTLAVDGLQAIHRLKEAPAAFDGVLMDMRMPVMDGLTATRLIRDDLGLTELPVIALTAGVRADQQEAARAAGVNDLLAKPMDLEQLVVLLTKWVTPRASAATAVTVTGPGRRIPATTSVAGQAAATQFPAIAGIDRARAAEILGHNRDLFLWLLKQVADEFAPAAAQTRQDLAQGERETAARRMHTLRNHAGSLGALDLMALAGELEGAIDRGETDLEAPLAALDRLLAELLAASAPWLGATPGGAMAAPQTPPAAGAAPPGDPPPG